MAFLDRSRGSRAAALLLLLCCTACAVWRAIVPGERRFAFSHERHVTLEKLDCVNCHAEALASDQPGMPARDTCDVCHSEIDATQPAEKRIETLFHGDEFAAAHAAKLADELVFSHRLHASGKQACNACHRGIEHSADVLALPRVRMDDCTHCHAERAVAGAESCAQCHRAVRREWAPRNHDANWIRAHGLVARERSQVSAERCALCHEESSCDQCHRVQAPENHTPYWHERAHGLVAMSDRQNCAACHEPESCERCHAQSRPRNHVGTWGATLDTHCLTCHQPLASEECSACHQATPSHETATHQPPDHFPGMNCRQCHGVSPRAPLPHVDNGDDCSSCHH
jgi:hypothetical protein